MKYKIISDNISVGYSIEKIVNNLDHYREQSKSEYSMLPFIFIFGEIALETEFMVKQVDFKKITEDLKNSNKARGKILLIDGLFDIDHILNNDLKNITLVINHFNLGEFTIETKLDSFVKFLNYLEDQINSFDKLLSELVS